MLKTCSTWSARRLLVAGAAVLFCSALVAQADEPAAKGKLLEPQPIVAGDKVVTLFPPGHPALKTLADYDKPENVKRGNDGHVLNVTNIHNPSIEVHLPPKDKANGMAVIVAAGGGNTTLWVGPEGTDVAHWLNRLGVAAFTERYRLQPYSSAVDALADTLQSVRMVRAHAAEWGVDPKRIGIMGFSAGGEQAARAALFFDEGKSDASDPVDRVSSRPDFVVLVYAGWKELNLSHVPKNAPPAFCTSAGIDDAFHAKETVDFYNAYFNAKIPVELHIYGHGGHGGGLGSRQGIPFGTWQNRFVDWAVDLKLMPKPAVGQDAK
ncbi:MAG TPA: alpha/beta hydrolase [Pirellulales bacterium]|nr:alpha/beta hydrolase [Pirellulales bacterium]